MLFIYAKTGKHAFYLGKTQKKHAFYLSQNTKTCFLSMPQQKIMLFIYTKTHQFF